VIAHVGGLPVEEILPALMSGGAVWLTVLVTSLGARLRGTRARSRTAIPSSPSLVATDARPTGTSGTDVSFCDATASVACR
jgi:hypothetical protein